MLHFAYGSNMDAAMMRRRCPTARFEGRAVLVAYRFMIMREGYATVVPAPGAAVHGVLWRLAVRDLAALIAYEGLACGLYRPVTLPVMADGRRRAALVYVAASRVRGRPRPGYMEVVMAAARAAALPPDYVRDLARHQRMIPISCRLFGPDHAPRQSSA
jgi:gamma-glutamylcyclotransferase (GGCT)/AIG2-like uncharacterized protein YtfP